MRHIVTGYPPGHWKSVLNGRSAYPVNGTAIEALGLHVPTGYVAVEILTSEDTIIMPVPQENLQNVSASYGPERVLYKVAIGSKITVAMVTTIAYKQYLVDAPGKSIIVHANNPKMALDDLGIDVLNADPEYGRNNILELYARKAANYEE